jgi:hypothetical protein
MAQNPDEKLKEVQETVEILKDAFNSLGAQIRANLNANLAGADATTKQLIKKIKFDLTASINGLGKKSEQVLENQLKLNKGQLASKDIAKQLLDLENKRLKAANDLKLATRNGLIPASEARKLYLETKAAILEGKEELENQRQEALKIEKAMGNLGKVVKGLNKIPILGGLIDSEKVLEKMQETAVKTKNPLAVMATGFSQIGKSVIKGILDPFTLILFLFNQALKANKQTVELGKALGKNSYEYRENLAAVVRSSSNINVTTANLVESFNEIAQATGFAYEFTSDQLITQTKLTKQVGLQADEAAQIQRLGVLNNTTSEKTYNSFVKGLVATRNQLKVGINFKATLAEAVKVSGQLAANLGYNPERIAKAIVTAKAFGMTLDQVAKSGESLLNFESSIESELKAELITGKQINLEKARMAALTGDQVTLAEELSNQIGTSADFTKMNVIQQKSLADAVGMTTDELAESLRKREEAIASGKSLAQITADEATQAIERQNIQERFNQAILKLQDIVGNLVAGPLGQMLEMFANILSNTVGMSTVIGTLIGSQIPSLIKGFQSIVKLVKSAAKFSIAEAMAKAASSAASIPGIGWALAGGVAAGLGAMLYTYLADDLVSPGYGKRTLTTSEGTFKLNDKDTVLAGTDLNGKNTPMSTPTDLTPMINAINEVRTAIDRLYNKNTSINMDGNKVGSTLVQNSYKLA